MPMRRARGRPGPRPRAAPPRAPPPPAQGRGGGRRSRRGALTGALAPAACLMVVAGLRGAAGAAWAGLLVPFPAAATALLVATHAEAGPAAACRVAAAVPRGSLGTLAFLV